MSVFVDLTIERLPNNSFRAEYNGKGMESHDLSAVIQWAFLALPPPPKSCRLFFKRQNPGELTPAYIRSLPTFERIDGVRWGRVVLRFTENEGDRGIKDPLVSGTYLEVARTVADKLKDFFFT